ncbi:MAG: amidohydrolase family protein [Janthinobacterium lividum]
MRKALLFLLLTATSASAAAQADLVVLHGRIWTENPAQPEAQALAVSGHRIIAIGADADIQKLVGAHTRVLDVHGHRVVPGFNDAHVHFFWGGQGLASVQLTDAPSRAAFIARIAAYARTRPTGEWIVDGNWDEQKWSPVQLPNHDWIDAVTPNNPVWVQRSDGHMCKPMPSR